MGALINKILKEIDQMVAMSDASNKAVNVMANGLRKKLLHFNAGNSPSRGHGKAINAETKLTVTAGLRESIKRRTK